MRNRLLMRAKYIALGFIAEAFRIVAEDEWLAGQARLTLGSTREIASFPVAGGARGARAAVMSLRDLVKTKAEGQGPGYSVQVTGFLSRGSGR
jgi:hypothetical protein